MDFIDELRSLSNRAAGMHGVLETEEATKTALILPFIRILGYDIFNPTEVIPDTLPTSASRRVERSITRSFAMAR